MRNNEMTTPAAGPPETLAYNPNVLRSFSTWATASVIAGLALTVTTATLAVGYGFRIKALHDLDPERATIGDVRNIYVFVRWMLYVDIAVAVVWGVTLFRWGKQSLRLIGIDNSQDAALRRRQFKHVLDHNPDWRMFRRWQRFSLFYAVLWVGLRFAIPTAERGTLAYLESVNRRALIIDAVYVVMIFVGSALAWNAKKAVEIGAMRSMANNSTPEGV